LKIKHIRIVVDFSQKQIFGEKEKFCILSEFPFPCIVIPHLMRNLISRNPLKSKRQETYMEFCL
jgi:hypothetical protein